MYLISLVIFIILSMSHVTLMDSNKMDSLKSVLLSWSMIILMNFVLIFFSDLSYF